MAQHRVRLISAEGADAALLGRAFARIRAEAGLPDAFPPEVLAAAERAAEGGPPTDLPDLTALPFFTIDPVGSMDLDQAIHLERRGDGHRLRYAIADVPVVVPAGGPVDAEARRRGQTVYCPDVRVPLHPPVLSEGAASLLPGQVRPAYVWQLDLDGSGEVTAVELRRALVRSVDRLDDESVQRAVDAGSGDERFVMLREVGTRRLALEAARGGVSLQLPEQEVVAAPGGYSLQVRPASAVADWNAQLSLATGMAAAQLMLQAGVGVLRTLPAPTEEAIDRFRRQALALGAEWPQGQTYGGLLRSLDRDDPRHVALTHSATALFRGAGYTAFDGEPPAEASHAAVGAPYAHVTAPLRRLVDRFGLVVSEAVSRGAEVPAWTREALPDLPATMASSDRVASTVGRACTDAVEAAVLSGRVGETFDAVVVDRRDHGGVVQLLDPAVVAKVDGDVELGSRLRVRLTDVDVEARTVHLVPAPPA
ncbi:RNB domain-containing ribonuclease [Angustibacter aerolatus]